MKAKKKLMIIALLALAMGSCEKEAKNDLTTEQDTSKTLSPEERILTDEQVLEVATLHNEHCDLVISDLDASLPIEDITANAELIMDDFPGFEEEVPVSSPVLEDEVYASINDYSFNTAEMTALYETLSNLSADLDIDNPECNDNLNATLDDMKMEATGTFSGTDLDAAHLFIETFRYSADFWLPESSGGTGVGYIAGYEILDIHIDGDVLPLITFKEVIANTILADAVSSFVFFMVVAGTAIANPALIPGSLIAAWGATAARASIRKFVSGMAELIGER